MPTKLQAIVKEELDSIPEGFTGTILKGHTVIDVVSDIPPYFDYLRVSFHAEWGTGRTSTGLAEVCTDLNGNQLRGFKTVTAGEGKGSEGWINTSMPFISVNVCREGDNIKVNISKATIVSPEEYDLSKPVFNTETIWKYDGHVSDANLPESLTKYQHALDCVINKSYCYHCHCLHFYGRS